MIGTKKKMIEEMIEEIIEEMREEMREKIIETKGSSIEGQWEDQSLQESPVNSQSPLLKQQEYN